MASGFVGKKVSHQRIKVAELAADPEALRKFVAHGQDKYILTQVVAGKDWGIGTIWKLVQDADGPVLARVFDGVAPDGLRIIDEAAKGEMPTKTASLHVPTADVTERVASGIAMGGSEMEAVDHNVTPIVLDWIEAGFVPASAAHIAKMADAQLKAGKLAAEEAAQVKANAARIFHVAQNYMAEKSGSLFADAAGGRPVTGPMDVVMRSLASYKPKAMSWGRFASVLNNLLTGLAEKKAGEIPPQFQKKDDGKKDEKPGEKKDAKPGEKKDDGKKLPPWLEKKKDA